MVNIFLVIYDGIESISFQCLESNSHRPHLIKSNQFWDYFITSRADQLSKFFITFCDKVAYNDVNACDKPEIGLKTKNLTHVVCRFSHSMEMIKSFGHKMPQKNYFTFPSIWTNSYICLGNWHC